MRRSLSLGVIVIAVLVIVYGFAFKQRATQLNSRTPVSTLTISVVTPTQKIPSPSPADSAAPVAATNRATQVASAPVSPKIGQRTVVGAVALTVNAVQDPFVGTIYGSRTPDTRYVAVDVTFENLGATPLDCLRSNVMLVDAQTHRYLQNSEIIPDPSLKCAVVLPGEKERGWVGFAVQTDIPLATFRYEPATKTGIVVINLT